MCLTIIIITCTRDWLWKVGAPVGGTASSPYISSAYTKICWCSRVGLSALPGCNSGLHCETEHHQQLADVSQVWFRIYHFEQHLYYQKQRSYHIGGLLQWTRSYCPYYKLTYIHQCLLIKWSRAVGNCLQGGERSGSGSGSRIMQWVTIRRLLTGRSFLSRWFWKADSVVEVISYVLKLVAGEFHSLIDCARKKLYFRYKDECSLLAI